MTLLSQKYIDRQYDASYKIDRKPARYYLTKKGIALLKTEPDFDPFVLHAYYKNAALTEETQQHYLDAFAVYNTLQATYGDACYLFTKSELAGFDGLPDNRPDIYLRNANGNREYFVILVHDAQLFIARKRLKECVEHSEEEGWPTGTYPTLLFVFASRKQEAQFLTFAEGVLDSAGIDNDELPVATSTLESLTRKPHVAATWMFAGERVGRSLE